MASSGQNGPTEDDQSKQKQGTRYVCIIIIKLVQQPVKWGWLGQHVVRG